MARKAKSYTFPVVAWDDIEGKDIWVGDCTGSINDPLAAQYENADLLASLEAEFGQVYVVREVP